MSNYLLDKSQHEFCSMIFPIVKNFPKLKCILLLVLKYFKIYLLSLKPYSTHLTNSQNSGVELWYELYVEPAEGAGLEGEGGGSRPLQPGGRSRRFWKVFSSQRFVECKTKYKRNISISILSQATAFFIKQSSMVKQPNQATRS